MKLYPHQEKAKKEVIGIIKDYGVCYLAGQVRTGKTLTSLAVSKEFGHLNCLFVTKKKAIGSIEKDMDKIGYKTDIINYASLHKVSDRYQMVIIDEAHSIGAYPRPNKRARQLKRICKGATVLLLSGTPTPESFSQAYHQLWVSDCSPWNRYRTFYAWAKNYVNIQKKWIGSMMVNDYSKGIESKIFRDLDPFMVRITQKDAGFVSYVQEKFINVEMTERQKSDYKYIDKHECIVDINVTCTNAADKMNKLAQISSGTIIDDDGWSMVNSRKKAERIKEHSKGKKIAIFYKYRAERGVIQETFRNITDSPEDFNASDDKIFIGQFQSIREGIDLRTADAIYMYNIDFSATSYWQSRARLQNKERTKDAVIYWVMTIGGIESYVYKCVKGKENFTAKHYKEMREDEQFISY